MGWARLDDSFHDHHKIVGLPLDAVGLYTLALTWAHRHRAVYLGHLPAEIPARLAGPRWRKLAALLVSKGLWDVDSDTGGWAIHDFVDYLAADDDRLTASEKRRKLSDAGRAAANARWSSRRPAETDATEDAIASEPHSDRNAMAMRPLCPRPDPSRTQPEEGQLLPLSRQPEAGEPADAKPKPKRKRQLPDDFEVTPPMRAWAAQHAAGVDVDAELAQFTDHHRARGSTMADWTAAWHTWMRNAVRFRARGQPRAGPGGAGQSTTDARVGAALALGRDMQARIERGGL